MAVEINVLIERVKNVIKEKSECGQSQQIDFEILAWISVYRHGSPSYKRTAFKTLRSFFVNAGFAGKQKDVIEAREQNRQLSLF